MKRNWKTTVFGALMLALSGFTIYTDPAKATDPQVMTTIAGGLGLLLAKDADKADAPQPAPAPAPPSASEPAK